MDDFKKEIAEKLDTAIVGIKEAQERSNKAAEKLDGIDKEVIEKAISDATGAMQELQEIKQKHDALQKENELLAKFVYRGDEGSSENSEQEYGEAFSKFLKKGHRIDEELIKKYADEQVSSMKGLYSDAREAIKKDLIEGIKPQGGYWVRPERSSQMVTRFFETSPLRQVANIMTTSTNEVELIVDDNEAAFGGWVGETQARPVTGTPDIGLLKIPVHEQFAQPQATQSMLDDAGFDVEGWLARKVQDKLGREQNTSFVTGDGSKKPKGFLSFDAWASPGVYERDAIEQIPTGSATDLESDGLIDVQNSLIEEYQPNAVWLMKRVTFGKVIKLKDNEDRYLINPLILREGAEKILLGQRVIFADDMPVVAGSALPVAYGDFSRGYTIVDRFGFRVIRDEFTNKPFIKFYTTFRVGGTVTNFESIKLQVVSV